MTTPSPICCFSSCDPACGYADSWGYRDFAGTVNNGLTQTSTGDRISQTELNANKAQRVFYGYAQSFNPLGPFMEEEGTGTSRMTYANRGVDRYQKMEETSDAYESALRASACCRGCLECTPCGCLINIPLDVLHTFCVLGYECCNISCPNSDGSNYTEFS